MLAGMSMLTLRQYVEYKSHAEISFQEHWISEGLYYPHSTPRGDYLPTISTVGYLILSYDGQCCLVTGDDHRPMA
jgi:hypothetical protein